MALLRGYLCVVVDRKRKFVRIGMTRDVYSRFHELQADCPLDLELVRYEPCTYARFREAKAHLLLKNLHVRGAWFRWNEIRVKTAVDEALALPNDEIRLVLDSLSTAKSRNYPVKREDTGEVYDTARKAAEIVLGDPKFAPKIRLAIKTGCKCGPTTWSRV